MAITIQSILQQHFDDYFAHHRWPAYVREAAERMRDCRTAAMGGHVQRCPHGHVQRVRWEKEEKGEKGDTHPLKTLTREKCHGGRIRRRGFGSRRDTTNWEPPGGEMAI